MTRTGRIEAVWLERRGTQLTAAAPEGTQVLSVGFTGDFDEDGGQLYHVPTGMVYDYSSFDANAETITLTAPLPAGESFDDGDALRVYPLADDAYAHVRLEDVASDEEPITARIDHALRGLLPEGQRETGAGEVATVENTGLGWVVRDVVGAGAVSIRGSLTVGDESGSYIRAESVEPNNTPHLTIQGDSDPDTHIDLFVDVSGTPMMEFADNVGDTYTARTNFNQSFSINSDLPNNPSFLLVKNEGVAFRSSQTGAPSLLFDNDTGFIKHGSYSPWTEESWNTFTLQNGWANLGGSWSTAQYKLYPDGRVFLKGVIRGGTLTDNTIIATLPVGYRPTQDQILMGGNATAVGTTPSVRIFASDGTIRIFAVSGTSNGAHSWDGLSFPVV